MPPPSPTGDLAARVQALRNRLAPARPVFAYRCWESPESVDAEAWRRTGQRVAIVRELGADETEVGRMFRVRFADGHEHDVFADELDELP